MNELMLAVLPWRSEISTGLFFMATYIGLRCLWRARQHKGAAGRNFKALGIGGLTLGASTFLPALGALPIMGTMGIAMLAGTVTLSPSVGKKVLAAAGGGLLMLVAGVAGTGHSLGIGFGASMWPSTSRAVSLLVLRTPDVIQRGDRMEFGVPSQQGSLDETLGWPAGRYHKRILGLPGDRIEFQGNLMLINDQQVANCHPRPGRQKLELAYTWLCQVQLPDQQAYTVVWGEPDIWGSRQKKWYVPKDHVWVMGDNSVESADSRDRGSIPAKWLAGKVVNSL